MTSTIRNRNMAKKMGENGRQTVETSFSVEKMVDETVDVYMELILDK